MVKFMNLAATLTSKLDLRKIQHFSGIIEGVLDKSLGFLGNIGAKSNQMMEIANQGLQNLEGLKDILKFDYNIVKDLFSKSDMLAQISTTGKEFVNKMLDNLFSQLNVNLLPKNVQDLSQTILTKINELNSGGGNCSFNIFDELQQLKNIFLSPESHPQKNDMSQNDMPKNECSLIKRTFDLEKTKELVNLIEAIQNTCNNLELNTNNNEPRTESNNADVLEVQQGLANLEEQKKLHNPLLAAKSPETVQVQTPINQVEQMIKTLITEGSTFANRFQKMFDVSINTNQNVSKLVTGVMHFFSANKSPTEESFQKELSHLFDKRDSLLSKMDQKNPEPKYKHMKGDQKSLDPLYSKLKQLFDHGTPDSTKTAADDETLRRMVTDKNYRKNY